VEVFLEKGKTIEINLPNLEADVVLETESGVRRVRFDGPGRYTVALCS